MRRVKKLTAISFLSFVLTLILMTLSCANEHPQEGSIHFGADKKPLIHTSPAFDQFKNAFADIAESVIPTVVTITSTEIDTVLYGNPMQQFFGLPFAPYGYQGYQQQPQLREQRRSGVGSGVIVSKDGYILTNSHVVKDADEIKVTLSDDREFDADIIGVDTLSDVAVIKIKEKVDNLPVAYLGTSSTLRPGDWVMAIGNPFNLSSTVTTGIVSALGRHTGGDHYQNFIQTDAAINPGNSGGALVNMDGELIGINTMIYTRSGGYMGIGFAIPIDQASRIMEQLIYNGKVTRGWLGVSIGKLDQNMRDALGIEKRGVLINEVFENQPADKAGVKGGDVILSIDGIRTKTPNDLRNAVAAINPNKEVDLVIIRDGKEKTLKVTLSDREKGNSSLENNSSNKALGLQFKESNQGLTVTKVDPIGKAARIGISVGDVITQIKIGRTEPFREINSEADLNKYLAQVKKGNSYMLQIKRSGRTFFAALKK